jgi:transcriptional regulator with XRE-family HTH domain
MGAEVEGGDGAPGATDARASTNDGGRRAVPTMRDIAELAGVSKSTVSRVLNDVPTRVPITAETRERVILAARKVGYRPNPLARGLRGAPTMLLGAVVRDIYGYRPPRSWPRAFVWRSSSPEIRRRLETRGSRSSHRPWSSVSRRVPRRQVPNERRQGPAATVGA